jgi:hypothetical protein
MACHVVNILFIKKKFFLYTVSGSYSYVASPANITIDKFITKF